MKIMKTVLQVFQRTFEAPQIQFDDKKNRLKSIPEVPEHCRNELKLKKNKLTSNQNHLTSKQNGLTRKQNSMN